MVTDHSAWLGSPLRSVLILGILAGMVVGCGSSKGEADSRQATDDLNIERLREILDMEGTVQDGKFKVTLPQNDLGVTVDGVDIIPPMGAGSWAAFAPTGDSALVMGDVVLQESEVQPVQQTLVEHGLTATALHKHFLREEPRVMYMHIGGSGSEEALAEGVRAVFDRVASLREGNPAEAEAQTVENTIDTSQVAETLGYDGSTNRGVYKVSIPRSDVEVTAHGTAVTGFMGLSTWAAWQGTPEQAAVAGDFAMTEEEVAPVIQTLAEHEIEVVAVHNHMVHEDPSIYFLHYWGQGSADKLAHGLRAALDQTGVSPDSP